MNCQLAFSNKQAIGVVTCSRKLSDNTDSTLSVTLGPQPSAALAFHRKLREKDKIKPEIRVSPSQLMLNLSYTRYIYKRLSVNIGSTFLYESTRKGDMAGITFNAGLVMKLSSYTKVSYGLDMEDDGLKVVTRFSRGGINLSLPISISHTFNTRAVTLGVIFLGLAAVLTKKLYDRLYKYEDKKIRQARKFEKRIEEIKAAQHDVLEYEMMVRDQVYWDKRAEIEHKGLVILEAYYGKKDVISAIRRGVPVSRTVTSEVIDVSIPLQSKVQNSKLFLGGSSKCHMAGFYNPCIDDTEVPRLYIKYSYGGIVYVEEIDDEESLYLP